LDQEIVVTGVGLHSCLGDLRQTWQGLLSLQSGIKIHQPFGKILPEMVPLPLALIAEKPTSLGEITRQVVADALDDAGLVAPLPDCGVVVGSSRSCQGLWEELHKDGNSLLAVNWLDLLPNQSAIVTARQIGSTTAVLAPMAACATGIWAIAQGIQLIRHNICQRVLVGAVEVPITPLTLATFGQMGALAKTGCYPFDLHREGLVLGEGGAVLVLESAPLALSRGAKIYGRVLGFGFSCDATHVSAPESEGKGALTAIQQCLSSSNLSPGDINYIHAHGTSTQLNDSREAKIIQNLFPWTVPVSSTKGAYGHTLGASGAMGVALCLKALKKQILPPCVGLKKPEFALDFVRKPRICEINNLLCLSFGFGGQNAVVSLGRLSET
jgi:3-oxoacyl-[acyl-carrier-protein] synthase II